MPTASTRLHDDAGARASALHRRFVTQTLWLGVLSSLTFAGLSHPGYDPRVYWLAALGFAALLWLARRPDIAPHRVAHALIVEVLALVVWGVVHSGGINSPKMLWLPLLMVTALLLLPRRQAMPWLLVLALLQAALFALGELGWIDTTLPYGAQTVWWTWLNRVFVIGTLVILMHFYQRMHRELIADNEARNQAVERTSRDLEQARAHKEEFMAAVGHELRTPMNAILGLNGVLRGQLAARADDVEIVDLIRRSTEQLLQVVNNILDFSQLQAGRMTLYPEPLALDLLLAAALDAHRARAQDAGFTLHLQAPQAPGVWLQADRVRLRQLLDHLLDNALKFSAGTRIVLQARPVALGWRFEVSDDGVGLSPPLRERVFQLFEQPTHQARRLHAGAGLGLALCAQLVRLHGGRIGAEDAEPGGACFWFELPLSRTEPPRVQDAATALARPQRTLAQPLRVLVVDDNELNRIVAQLMLRQHAPAAQVRLCDSGAEALSALAREPYDLVLMDVRMPGLDGLATTRALRAQDGPNAATPVLAMTALHGAEDRSTCAHAGMQGVIFKPLNPAQAMTVIAEALAAAPPGVACP